MSHHVTNEFSSITELQRQFGPFPKPQDWRLLHPAPYGAIIGLPSSRGHAVATNGILVVISQPHRLFLGHIASFVTDPSSPPLGARATRSNGKAKRKTREDITEFV